MKKLETNKISSPGMLKSKMNGTQYKRDHKNYGYLGINDPKAWIKRD